MSWSTNLIGTADKVNAELNAYSETLTGQSKEEFEEAKPHIQGLIALNVNQASQVIKLTAAGHATFENGVKKYGNCSVAIEALYHKVVT